MHTHTHYSLLDGLSKIDDLISRTKELEMDSVAITDHGVMYGSIEFYQKAKKSGIKPIIGIEAYIAENMLDKRSVADSGGHSSGKNYYHIILLASNLDGYKNIIKLSTLSHLEGFYYKPRIDKELLRKYSDGVIALSACLGGEISRLLVANHYEKAKRVALEYQEIFGKGNFFLEIQRHANIPEQEIATSELMRLSRDTNIPMVATQDSHYLRSEDAHSHDVLLAVQTGSQVDDKDRLTMRNDDFSLLSAEEMGKKFHDVPEAIENSWKIADRCELEIELNKLHLPRFPLPDSETPENHLSKLVETGLHQRYGKQISDEVRSRIEYELGVIEKTGFCAYFLIVADFVSWAKKNGIIVGPGRGSAAGSLVSYVLGITNIDPLEYKLLFERFLNPERVSQPDIDLDFDDARRDEVLEYVRQKYGIDHVAQIITFGTMAARGSIRDAGRALGFSYEFCDKLAKLIPFNPQQGEKIGFLKKCLDEVDELRQLYRTKEDVKTLIDAAIPLEGVVRHSSTHACAVVIAPKPLIEYLPLQKDSKAGNIITQYDMHAVEALGLLKMDFLGLANLTIIQNCLQLISSLHGKNINIDTIPLNDKKAFDVLKKGHSTGVFQLESSGMKRYLKDLKPSQLEDIIAMVSLYRPGPMELIPEYIARKHGKKAVEYLHPTLEPVLKNTFGIMVYQEQLMEAVRVLAGFSLAEADVLRKAVGKKNRKLLDEQEGKFKAGAEKIGTPKDIADKFWALVEPFNRYAFNRSHAACYAMIAYQTAYLKGNYPVEFMAALMNSHSDDIERIAFFIDECRTMDIDVLSPEINQSMEKFSVISQLEDDKGNEKIRFGLAAIKNVGSNVVRTIIEERNSHGAFTDIEDFMLRVDSKDLNKKSLESLIKAGAMDAFGERTMLLNNLDELLNYSRESNKNKSMGQGSLFDGDGSAELPPLRLKETEPARKSEKLLWEKELLGLFISSHPLAEYTSKLGYDNGVLTIRQATDSKKSSTMKISGMITKVQKIITKTGKPMVFSVLEDASGKIELVVFPTVLEANSETFRENAIVTVAGRLNDRDGVAKFLCEDVRTVAMLV